MSEIAPEELTRRAQQSQRDKAEIAYGVDDLPYGRTFVYQLIREGKLKAKKCGRRTIITPEAWREHVAALPEPQSHGSLTQSNPARVGRARLRMRLDTRLTPTI
jgi:hypothetical protein